MSRSASPPARFSFLLAAAPVVAGIPSEPAGFAPTDGEACAMRVPPLHKPSTAVAGLFKRLLIVAAVALVSPSAAAAGAGPSDDGRAAASSLRGDATGGDDVAAERRGPRWRRPLPTANAALLGFLVGGTVGGAALMSSTAFAVNAMVLSVGTGAGSPPPPPLVNALMMAGFYGAPLLILAAGAGAVASVAAALWWGDAGWLSIALGAGGLLVAGALAVPIAVMASTLLALTVIAPVTNWRGALGPAGTLMMTTGMVGASIVVVSVGGGLVLGAITAGTAAAGASVSEALE